MKLKECALRCGDKDSDAVRPAELCEGWCQQRVKTVATLC